MRVCVLGAGIVPVPFWASDSAGTESLAVALGDGVDVGAASGTSAFFPSDSSALSAGRWAGGDEGGVLGPDGSVAGMSTVIVIVPVCLSVYPAPDVGSTP